MLGAGEDEGVQEEGYLAVAADKEDAGGMLGWWNGWIIEG